MKPIFAHRHLVDSITQAMIEIFRDSQYTDRVVEKAFKSHRKWGSRDRKFFAEQVYELVRWWKKYWFLLGEEPNVDPGKLIRLWAVHAFLSGSELPDWPELRGFSIAAKRLDELANLRAVRESIPDWMDEKGASELGSRWDSILRSLNEPSATDLRINSMKTTVLQAQKALLEEGVEALPVDGHESALTLKQRKNILGTKAFNAGLFEVQDRASQWVAPFLGVEPGMTVIDACAGAGGKSLHVADLMRGKGRIISMDVIDWKLKELRTRAQRNGVQIIETKLISSIETIQSLERSADRVLLDVPCSGMGVLRRNPDAKWKLRPENFPSLYQTQEDILKNYSQMTRVGGSMVYATCSILPSENEGQIEKFLSHQGSHWKLEQELRVDPDQGQGDGFYAARLLRMS